jgi:hypothetical protein
MLYFFGEIATILSTSILRRIQKQIKIEDSIGWIPAVKARKFIQVNKSSFYFTKMGKCFVHSQPAFLSPGSLEPSFLQSD